MGMQNAMCHIVVVTAGMFAGKWALGCEALVTAAAAAYALLRILLLYTPSHTHPLQMSFRRLRVRPAKKLVNTKTIACQPCWIINTLALLSWIGDCGSCKRIRRRFWAIEWRDQGNLSKECKEPLVWKLVSYDLQPDAGTTRRKAVLWCQGRGGQLPRPRRRRSYCACVCQFIRWCRCRCQLFKDCETGVGRLYNSHGHDSKILTLLGMVLSSFLLVKSLIVLFGW